MVAGCAPLRNTGRVAPPTAAGRRRQAAPAAVRAAARAPCAWTRGVAGETGRGVQAECRRSVGTVQAQCRLVRLGRLGLQAGARGVAGWDAWGSRVRRPARRFSRSRSSTRMSPQCSAQPRCASCAARHPRRLAASTGRRRDSASPIAVRSSRADARRARTCQTTAAVQRHMAVCRSAWRSMSARSNSEVVGRRAGGSAAREAPCSVGSAAILAWPCKRIPVSPSDSRSASTSSASSSGLRPTRPSPVAIAVQGVRRLGEALRTNVAHRWNLCLEGSII